METKKQTPRRSGRKWILPASLLIVMTMCGLVAWSRWARPAATSRSLYLTMRDGVKIAIDVWLPTNLTPGEKLPTILRSTGYWRSYGYSALGRILERLQLLPPDLLEGPRWVQEGYALILVDVRGTGASSGQWEIPWSENEIEDLGEVVDWIVAQPWSNGKVGAYGVSYDGNTAEMLARLQHPAVKAVAPQYSDFDLYALLVRPGGILNERFMRNWNEFHDRLGANDVCAFEAAAPVPCEQMKTLMEGVRPVDADLDGSLLEAAVAEHTHVDVFKIATEIEYRQDNWLGTGLTLGDVSPYRWREEIEKSGVPMYVWASWLDSGTIDGALSRYQTFSNPQTLVIGPWSHGGSYHVDPFLPADAAVEPSVDEQFQMLVRFFDAYLKEGSGEPPAAEIRYYTLGEGVWKNTTVWPPTGAQDQRWYFGPDQGLTTQAPAQGEGVDTYRVDWMATSGGNNRWFTSLFKGDVVYPNRADEDKKLLTYTSAPMTADVEITGTPIVTLYLASTENDGALHIYLEDVAPDGHVTYITEGNLRLIHHQVSDQAPPYTQSGPYHTLNAADARPMQPGEVTEVTLHLYATSVLIREGHSIRIAIAGHDASTFARYPAEGTPELQVYFSEMYPSGVMLPVVEK